MLFAVSRGVEQDIVLEPYLYAYDPDFPDSKVIRNSFTYIFKAKYLLSLKVVICFWLECYNIFRKVCKGFRLVRQGEKS